MIVEEVDNSNDDFTWSCCSDCGSVFEFDDRIINVNNEFICVDCAKKLLKKLTEVLL